MAVPRKTRSSGRRLSAHQKRRFFKHLFLAAILATLASLLLYKAAVDTTEPIVLAEASPIVQVSPTASPAAPLAAEDTPAPPTPLPPTEQPTPSSPVEQTAIALESATPPPTQDPALPTVTETPTSSPSPSPSPAVSPTLAPAVLYNTQPGDTLAVVALRFAVGQEEVLSPDPIPTPGYIKPGQLLVIPNRIGETSPQDQLLPDSEVVYSPSAVNFNIQEFVAQAGGYLSTYSEYLGSTGWTSGAEIIQRISLENSINPRILLTILEDRAHWVTGQPASVAETFYPLGALDRERRGLYKQLSWAVDQFSTGYYGWRDGTITSLVFPDGTPLRLYPGLNAGTVALQYLVSRDRNMADWNQDLYSEESLVATYVSLFGDPWIIAQAVEPLLPYTLQQPELSLPFQPGQVWSFTGGPHAAWNTAGARAAIDFAPPSMESGCVPSNTWITAVASGLVVRSANGVVVLDLDGDGHEQTGWVVMYLHVAANGRVAQGASVEVGAPIGHPSCEGGLATGTHVHIARKYNGEWILADGALPFNLSGYESHAGLKPYEGTLVKGDQTVNACTCSSRDTFISIPKE